MKDIDLYLKERRYRKLIIDDIPFCLYMMKKYQNNFKAATKEALKLKKELDYDLNEKDTKIKSNK